MAAQQFSTYRGFVYPWCIDHVGHMNVHSYVSRFDEASWHFLACLGLTPEVLAASNCGFVALDQRIQYRREVLQGSLLDVTTELTEHGVKTLRYLHRMRNSATMEEVASMDLLVGYIDLATRRMAPLPEGVTALAFSASASEVPPP